MSTQAKRVWPSGHRTKESMAVRTPDPGCDPGRVHDKKPPKWEAFLLNLGLIAQRGTSVTLDPFLSLPWPVVLTRAKRVWPSRHGTQGAILAGCMTKGLPKGRPFVFGLVLLPSAAAQYGCPDYRTGSAVWVQRHAAFLCEI